MPLFSNTNPLPFGSNLSRMTPNYTGPDPNKSVPGEGISRLMSALFGLDAKKQAPGISGANRAGLMNAGLALIGAPKTPGTFGQNILQAIQAGRSAAQGQQQADAIGSAMEGVNMPPQMRQLLEALGPQAQAQYAMQAMTQQPQDPLMTVGNSIYNRETGEWTAPPQAGGDPWDGFSTEFVERARARFGPAAMPSDIGQEGLAAIREQMDTVDTTRAGASAPRIYTGGEMQNEAERIGMKGLADMVVEGRPAAESAREELGRVARARRKLEEGDVLTGPLAEERAKIDNVLASLGLTDGSNAAATQELIVELKRGALDVIQNFPGQLSEKELEAAEFLSGDIEMQPATLKRLLDAAETVARARIRLHNETVQDIYGDNPVLMRRFTVSEQPLGGLDLEGNYQDGKR